MGVLVGSQEVGGGDLGAGRPREGVAQPSIPPPFDPTTLVGSQWWLFGQRVVKLGWEVSW